MLVYKATNKLNRRAYIGVTVTTKAVRWYKHCHDAKRGGTSPLSRAIRKYGREAFDVEVLYECSSVEEMMVCEKALVAAHGTMTPNGYNLTSGGDGWAGRRGPETIARMRVAQRKRVAEGRGSKGVKHSEGTKAKISARHKGKPGPSPEVRARISATLKANPKAMAQARSAAAANHVRNRGRKKTPEQTQRSVDVRRSNKCQTLKLTVDQVTDIRLRIMAGEQQAAIARRYGVTRSAIFSIKGGGTWKDVCPEGWSKYASMGT